MFAKTPRSAEKESETPGPSQHNVSPQDAQDASPTSPTREDTFDLSTEEENGASSTTTSSLAIASPTSIHANICSPAGNSSSTSSPSRSRDIVERLERVFQKLTAAKRTTKDSETTETAGSADCEEDLAYMEKCLEDVMTLKDSFEEERRERCEICLAIMRADTDTLKAVADPFDVVLGILQNLVDENSSLKVENRALLDASSSMKRELTETLSLLTVEREKREDARSEVRQLESDMEELEGRLVSDRSQHRASVAGSTLACEKLKEKLDKQQSQFQLEHEKIMNEANGLKMKTVELEQSVSLVTSVKNELASQVVEAENRFDLVCKELSRLLASGLTVCESEAEEPASDDEKINLIRKQIREFRENAKVEILKWKSLYEELKETHEGGLEVKKVASSGAASLEAQHADMMGHRNPKQKIHYVHRLRDENKALKAEVQQLQAELEKRKRQVWKLRSFSRDEPSSPSKGKK